MRERGMPEHSIQEARSSHQPLNGFAGFLAVTIAVVVIATALLALAVFWFWAWRIIT